jgi:DNA invertase Pin-like site-specific DNA recombinase
MRVAIYARVSTKDKGQVTENQLHQLREFAERHGIIIWWCSGAWTALAAKASWPRFAI